MATKTTQTGKDVQGYIRDVLGTATNAGDAALAAGYPTDSRYTQAYYAGVPYLYMYGDQQQDQALDRSADLYDQYQQAGDYTKTGYDDIAGMYDDVSYYDPANFSMGDYTANNIQKYMSPYEELVSQQANKRLKKSYDEGRGEREAQAARAGAFGGSGAAIQEEVARRNYLEQMADMNAQNLQSAFDSGAGLYSKEISDRLAAEQAGEASRQFGTNTELAGIQGIMATREQEAAQEAAAKEAEFAGLRGQSESVNQEANLAQQQKNMQLTNLNAMREAGAQKENTALERSQYGLDVAGTQSNILAPLSGGAIQQKNKTSTAQNILGGVTAAAGVAQGIGSLLGAAGGVVPNGLQYYMPQYRHGGYVYSGGGLAELQPQYYTMYER